MTSVSSATTAAVLTATLGLAVEQGRQLIEQRMPPCQHGETKPAGYFGDGVGEDETCAAVVNQLPAHEPEIVVLIRPRELQ